MWYGCDFCEVFSSKANYFNDFRILWRKNEIAEAESMQLAVFYSNALFLILLIMSAFFFFKNYTPVLYPYRL